MSTSGEESPMKDDSETPDLEMLGPPREDVGDSKIPEPREDKTEEVFEVRAILEHEFGENGLLLKVAWVGYGPDEDSWEPETDLIETAGEIVTDYMSRLPEKQKAKIEKFKKKLTEKKGKSKSKSKGGKAKKEKRSSSSKRDSATPKNNDRKPKKEWRDDWDEDEDEDDDDEVKEKKARKRKDSDSSDAGDDYSPAKKKARNSSIGVGPKKEKVTTKAAVKAYESQPQQASSCKKAAMSFRQGWLNEDSGSSDEEEEKDLVLSFDKEIKAKVSSKSNKKVKTKEDTDDEEHEHEPVPKLKLKIGARANSTTPTATPTLSKKQKKEEKQEKAKALARDEGSTSSTSHDPITAQIQAHVKEHRSKETLEGVLNSISGTGNGTSDDSDSNPWYVDGMVQTINDKQIIVLVTNPRTGERRTTTAREAYDLTGWNFCQYLLQRAVF